MVINNPGGPLDRTKPLVLRVYQAAFSSFDMGYVAAQSVMLFTIFLTGRLIRLRMIPEKPWVRLGRVPTA